MTLTIGTVFQGGCERKAPTPAVPNVVVVPAPKPRLPPKPDPDAVPPAESVPLPRRAIQVVNGDERIVDTEVAKAKGLTVVDLSDSWAPFIFQDGSASDGAPLPNRYRAVFVGLANDRSDEDGQPLRPGTKNYLELFGIPPSLSVLRDRFVADAGRSCEAGQDTAPLLAVDEIETWGATTEKKEIAQGLARGRKLEAARDKAGLATLLQVAQAEPKFAREIKAHERFLAQRAAFAEIEKRLGCEGLLDAAKHVVGLYDSPLRAAVLAFQQRNVIMSQGDLTRSTLEALARPVLENDFRALRRVLEERSASAGALIEDGSAPGGLPNLVGLATDAVLERLGIVTPSDAVAFFRRHAASDFRWLKVVARFSAPPTYYGDHMELSAEIDRGDIWYDFPFNAKGERLPQPRRKFPSFTLFVKFGGKRVPIAKWRTTIGSWRTELASDGDEYLRYKESDVGPRVWRHIVAAPVWIPPLSTPLGGMVKRKWENGAPVRVTNYDEVGPGYLSAYGLVAGIHVEMRKRESGTTYFDNGIRTHGTFDYMSLRGRFSHGCHRLFNNLAVRLFSFVLQHRHHQVMGAMALNFRRTFFQDDGVFDMRLPTRGFYFELDPPLPIETLEGEIKGVAKKPPTGYLRKPGFTYSTSAPPAAASGADSKASGAAEVLTP